jgi:hypothetical protein
MRPGVDFDELGFEEVLVAMHTGSMNEQKQDKSTHCLLRVRN